MADWERKTIPGHLSRENASLPFGCAFFLALFGGVFWICGLVMILSLAGVMPGGVWHAPPAVGACTAIALLAMGGLVAIFPMRSWIRWRRDRDRAQRLFEERPWEPWLADHDWDPGEARNDDRNLHFTLLFGAFFLFFFLTPFNWFAFFADDGRWTRGQLHHPLHRGAFIAPGPPARRP